MSITRKVCAIAMACGFSVAAHASYFDQPLTASDTGEYLIKFNQQSAELANQLKADKVSSLTTDAGKQLWLVNLTFEQAQALQNHHGVDYIEPDNYQSFYQPQTFNRDFEQANSDFTLSDEFEFTATNEEILASLGDSEHVPYGISMVNADKVADNTYANKTICIIDSGLQADHNDFSGLNVTGNHSSYSGFWHIDQVQHGTHVAGTVAALENGTGVVGVIKNGGVNVYVQKLSNGQPGNNIRISDQLEAMEVCANQGAEVVSMSFGGPRPYNAVNDIIDRLTQQRGMLFVGAAGNHGRPVNPRICEAQPTDELKQACFNAHKAPHYPASFHNVMSVANINKQALKAASSPINPEIEIAAPGSNVLSTVAKPFDIFSLYIGGAKKAVAHIGNTGTEFSQEPLSIASCAGNKCLDSNDLFTGKACLYQFDFRNFNLLEIAQNCAASGGEMMVMYPPIFNMGPIRGSFGTPLDLPVFSIGNNDARALLADSNAAMTFNKFSARHNFLTGTSMATPHVSAVATKVWSLNPSCTNTQIRKVLQHTSQDLGDEGRDVAFGFGLVDTLAAHQYIQANGCDIPTPACPDAWYFNQAYTGGEQVVFDGTIYEANWWSKNSQPSVSAAWKEVKACQ